MKKELLITSALSLLFLGYIFYTEIISPDYLQYQKAYSNALQRKAVEEGRIEQKPLKFGVRQFYLTDLNRVDRCVSCHISIEDPYMKDAKQPLTTHPGNFLDMHDINKVGCTICHDGQGRALTAKDAHAIGLENWDKPVLPGKFVYSNCLRCHEAEDVPQAPILKKGRDIFFSNGCLGCHKYKGRGGKLGPDLTNIADASTHLKHPVTEVGKSFVTKYGWNENIGYIYESIVSPHAQPTDTAMMDFNFDQQDALALTLFLKGLSKKAVPASYLEKIREGKQPENLDGKALFNKYCISCHGKDGKGGVKNINYAKHTVPALNTMAEKLFIEYPEDAKYLEDLLNKGVDIEHMQPPLDLDSARRVIAQFNAVKQVIKNGSPAAKENPKGPAPKLHMPSWADGLTDRNIDSIIAYLLSLYQWPAEDY